MAVVDKKRVFREEKVVMSFYEVVGMVCRGEEEAQCFYCLFDDVVGEDTITIEYFLLGTP